MATNRGKSRAGVAAKPVTQIAAGYTALDDTQSTPSVVTQTPTKRRYKARARLCACGCGQRFTPTPPQPKQRFATATCRQRARRAKQPKRARRSNGVDWYTCEHCGLGYVGVIGKGRKYCTSACKRAAAKARREAVALGLAEALGMPLEDARDRVELVGMEAARRAVDVLAS